MQTLNQPFILCCPGADDKFVLDGYPGEEGFSPRKRLAVIVGAAVGAWAALLTPLLSFLA